MAVSRVQIIGLGATTPIGRTVWTSAAAARAGICGFNEHPFMIDTAGEPMRVARAPWLDVAISGAKRFCALLFPAIDEALARLTNILAEQPVKIGLALALPQPRPGQPKELTEAILVTIKSHYGELFIAIQHFAVGHAAGHLALDAAIKQFTSRTLDVCVVAGVDSYLEPETLEWIEECDQLHGGGEFNNAWGLIPGEAAGAVLVTTEEFAWRNRLPSFGEVLSVGISQETKLIKTDAVCIGEGLTQAFRSALTALMPGEQIHNVFCDMNGEKYRADEYGFSTLRTKEHFCSASDFIAYADCWGDVGAAGVPLHIAQAVIANRKHYSKGLLSFVWASSESGERGAAVIKAKELPKGA
jgi:3-oxoacyl-[acyl-carrier-protein] synthase-1